MKRQLILLTSHFPFTGGETFLALELPFLANKFDEIIVLTSSSSSDLLCELPSNCRLERMNLEMTKSDKLRALKGMFSSFFWEERRHIKTHYSKPLEPKTIRTIMVSLFRAQKVKSKLEKLRKEEGAEKKYLYSYWCDDTALGMALYKEAYPETVCISRVHGWDVYFERSTIGYLPFRKKIQTTLNRIFAVSEKGKRYAENVWKVPNASNIEVAYLGVLPQVKLTVPVREKFIIVTCSSLIELKRVGLLIDALSLIKNVAIHWIHFGDGVLRHQLENQAKSVLSSSISFQFMGQMENHKILANYKNLQPDLFVNLSSTEGLPVSIMEAMSFGIPVMATDVGGTSEIVTEENGILLKSNPTALEVKESLVKIMQSPLEMRVLKSANAYAIWKAKFDADKNYSDFADLVASL